MSVLMRAREITGRPVVTLDTAEDVAEVRDVVFSYAEARVVGFTLNKRGRFSGPLKEVLPLARVSALGRDALMVASGDAVGADDEAMAAAARDRKGDVIGAAVLTDAGKELGQVVDVVVSVAVGTPVAASVVGFEMHGPAVERDRGSATLLMPVADTIAVSDQALVVPAGAEEFVRDDLAGFGSAVEEFRARLRGGSR